METKTKWADQQKQRGDAWIAARAARERRQDEYLHPAQQAAAKIGDGIAKRAVEVK